MTKRAWNEKRAQQGYSHQDVLLEMRRRFEGERTFDEAEARRRFKDGIEKLDRAFRFSASLCDVMDREKLTYNDLQDMAGIQDHDCLLLMLLDPVSRGRDSRRSLRYNREVDCFYPGSDAAPKK
jgi:hypothetical protein